MLHKVWWLFFWMTIAFWVGCAGENQNYRINEDQTPLLQEGYPTEPGHSDGANAPDASPSLTGLTRDGWPIQTISPASGLVPHHPHYFTSEEFGHTWLASADRPSPLRTDGEIVLQAAAVTTDARNRYNMTDIADQCLVMAKFTVDTAVLPAKVLIQPPPTIKYSPQD